MMVGQLLNFVMSTICWRLLVIRYGIPKQFLTHTLMIDIYRSFFPLRLWTSPALALVPPLLLPWPALANSIPVHLVPLPLVRIPTIVCIFCMPRRWLKWLYTQLISIMWMVSRAFLQIHAQHLHWKAPTHLALIPCVSVSKISLKLALVTILISLSVDPTLAVRISQLYDSRPI